MRTDLAYRRLLLLLFAWAAAWTDLSAQDPLERGMNAISRDQMKAVVATLVDAGGHGSRVTFTAGNDSAAQWILRTLRSLPLDSSWADTFYATQATPPWNAHPLVNVVGLLRGTERPHEIVVLGAHYDCSASNEGDWPRSWFQIPAPGADDNASGVAIVLEIARVLGEIGYRGSRSLLVAAFAAEETSPAIPAGVADTLRHHLGSAELAARLREEEAHVSSVLILDMVGYNPGASYLDFVADKPSQGIALYARSLIRELGLPLECNDPPFPFRTYSDHEAFVRHGFPALLLIEHDPPWQTAWPYYERNPFYHTSSDRPEYLNWELMETVAKLALGVVMGLLTGPPDQDLQPPPAPTLLLASATGDKLRMLLGQEGGPGGVQICVYEPDPPWVLPRAPAAVVPSGTTVLQVPREREYSQICLTAQKVGIVPIESARSDVYPVAKGPRGKLLLVDGFDRWGGSGSWSRPYHWFACLWGGPLAELGFSLDTSTNELVEDGTVDLRAYDAVFWLLGDESTEDETFTAQEQGRIRDYLRAGGRLFVSGSEIGWDLGARGSSSDRVFLRDYLRCIYQADDANSYEVLGVEGSPFAGLHLAYGARPYLEDYPDVLAPSSAAHLGLQYANGLGAGVYFVGKVPGGTVDCQVVVLGFPLETVEDEHERRALLERVLQFFGLLPTHVAEGASHQGREDFELSLEAWPNPFNDALHLRIRGRVGLNLSVRVWNVRGQRVTCLFDRSLDTSEIDLGWEAESCPSGTYLVEAIQGGRRSVLRVVLIR
ncbi:MAG: M28 family peptidase [candidate division KSB1 bacterium]|nr:M28 family peptidase [candidate division KSB1 bacterium]